MIDNIQFPSAGPGYQFPGMFGGVVSNGVYWCYTMSAASATTYTGLLGPPFTDLVLPTDAVMATTACIFYNISLVDPTIINDMNTALQPLEWINIDGTVGGSTVLPAVQSPTLGQWIAFNVATKAESLLDNVGSVEPNFSEQYELDRFLILIQVSET